MIQFKYTDIKFFSMNLQYSQSRYFNVTQLMSRILMLAFAYLLNYTSIVEKYLSNIQIDEYFKCNLIISPPFPPDISLYIQKEKEKLEMENLDSINAIVNKFMMQVQKIYMTV